MEDIIKNILENAKYANIKTCYEFSSRTLKRITDKIEKKVKEQNLENEAKDYMISVAGSYGRMEANPESDLDFMIICRKIEKFELIKRAYCRMSNQRAEDFNKSIYDASDVVEKLKKIVSDIAKEENIKLPKSDGAFSSALCIEDILQHTGHFEESLITIAQRLLLIMESKPIFNKSFFNECIEKILNKYFADIKNERHKEPLFLINDIIRYFRSICVNYQYNFLKTEENSKWALRNLKLRHSRIIMYAGLLFVVMNSSMKQKSHEINDKDEYILKMLEYPPLFRIAKILDENKYSTDTFLTKYNYFLGEISKDEVRKSLSSIDYEKRYENINFKNLKENSDEFLKDLADFIYFQKARFKDPKILPRWSDDVFENIIF